MSSQHGTVPVLAVVVVGGCVGAVIVVVDGGIVFDVVVIDGLHRGTSQ